MEQNYHKLQQVQQNRNQNSQNANHSQESIQLMQPKPLSRPPLQQSLSKHKKNYQKYLNNIYQTIKEKQFYIHRSKTPNMQIPNHNDLSKMSERGTAGHRDQGLKSLPKLSAKQTISNQVMDIVLAVCENGSKQGNSKQVSRIESSIKKKHSSSQKKPVVVIPQSQNSIYHFRNFPEPKPSINTHMMYGSPTLKQSKQLAKNPPASKHKILQQEPSSKKVPLSERSKRPSNQNSDNQKVSIYKKISKDNMNLLGLNVQKINYSEKREVINSNRRQMFMKLTRAEEKHQKESDPNNFAQQQGQNVYVAVMSEQNNFVGEVDESGVVLSASRRRLSPEFNNMIDMEACEQLISQKMQFSKRQSIIPSHHSKISNPCSPNRQRRRISATDKKALLPSPQQELNPIYENRYKKYLDLMLKLSFSYRKYGEMDSQINACSHVPIRNDKKYRAWIGTGNNGNLIIALIKRRFWWQIVEEKSWGVNFLWTQLKNNEYFKAQGEKLKQKNTILAANFSKEIEASTKMDESTSLSVDNDKHSETKSSLIKKTRAQSSLPGSINNRKSSVSPVRKQNRQHASDQQSKQFAKLLSLQEIAQYKRVLPKIQSKPFPQKLQLLQIQKFNPSQCRTHNHLMNNFYLGNKKALFHNLKQYYSLTGGDLFKTVPLTFHIKKGIKDPQYKRFLAYYKKRQTYIKKQEKEMELGLEEKRKMRNIWIVKPGENTNRGNGITVIDQVYELNSIFKSQGTHNDGSQKTFIVQLYIDRPLLYRKRKFDIRHYMTITHIHGVMKGYWFEQGYIRTSGYEFDVENFEREIHLTNDAVQKYTPNYGRFQPANKISYAEFQKYLDQTYPKKGYDFYSMILPRMKEICLDAIKSACLKLSPQKLEHNFELFGMDFMIDSDFVPWLIEINTNPCLELTNALQSRLIPQVVDETLRLSLDVIYPPPCHYPNTYRHLVPDNSNMKAELIFDESIDGEEVRKLYQKRKSNEKALLEEIGELEDDEVYEDQGQQDIKLDELLQ